MVNLRNQNKADVIKAKYILSEHNDEKPFVEENLTNIIQQNKKLKA